VSLEERVARIEGTVEQMDRRLNHIETEIGGLRRDLDEKFLYLDKKLDRHFLWLLGVRISMWITIILAILFK
jgi:hypothetical protein